MRERLLLVAAALAGFGASLSGSFHLDDYSLLGGAPPAILTRPLTYLTFWLNWRLAGDAPLSWHAVNLAIHLAAVWLAAETLERLLPRPAALIAAATFALHPIQAEAVNYVFARATLLSTLFCILSLRSWAGGHPWRAVVWFGVALLGKEEVIAFPLALVVTEPRRWRAITVMLALAILAGGWSLYAATVTPGSGAGPHAGYTPLQYLSWQGDVVVRYLRQFLLPAGFSFDPEIRRGSGAWGLPLLLLLIPFPGRRWAIAAIILLLPSSSIFPAADLAADRRMYLPALMLGACVGLLFVRWGHPKLFVAVALLWIGLSAARTQVWRTEEALWTDALAKGAKKVRPRIHLARNVSPERAVRLLEQAKAIAPNDAAVASELGRAWIAAGQPARALSEFGRALALEPNDAEALSNRGVALLLLGQSDAARHDFERALARDPCLFAARLNLQRIGVATPDAGCRYTQAEREALEVR
ncbi:MAG TPA: tetratricopeptide repeat protein [Bryobacteraceae bacterium]|nr:tetratricopeptide repeat protein [Bryobacteraceae bacterium]